MKPFTSNFLGDLSAIVALAFFVLTTGCASNVSEKESIPVFAAKQEAERRGWKKVKIRDLKFTNGIWEVHIYRLPLRMAGSDAFVSVLPDGTITDFWINSQ